MMIDTFKHKLTGWYLLVILLFSSCTVGPDYSAPVLSVPTDFTTDLSAEPAVRVKAAPPQAWWKLFGDKTLDVLIDKAVQENHDIRLAKARLQESRAGSSGARAELFPTVAANTTAASQQQSKNSPSYQGGDRQNDRFHIGFDAAWEIDIFGGVQRSVEAAEARQQAATAGLAEVVRTVLAEVAIHYIELRGLQQRQAVLLKNIKVQRQTLTLTQNKLASGLGNELEVSQARAQLLSARSALPGIESAMRRHIFQISTLLGEHPQQRLNQLLAFQPLPQIPDTIYADTPSEVIRRRPDIRQAEQLLAAEIADIGTATATLFPRFALFGSLGAESAALDNLFTSDSELWSFGPSIRWHLFQGGKIRAAIEAQEAQAQAALVNYEKTVLTVLQEVNSALAEHRYLRQTVQALAAAQQQSQTSVELSTTLYQEGLSDILTVLRNELLLLLIEDQYTTSLTQEWTSLIRLYKALGGGWQQPSAQYQGELISKQQ